MAAGITAKCDRAAAACHSLGDSGSRWCRPAGTPMPLACWVEAAPPSRVFSHSDIITAGHHASTVELTLSVSHRSPDRLQRLHDDGLVLAPPIQGSAALAGHPHQLEPRLL